VLIIDRFEGQFAVIEFGGITFNLPQSLLPDDATEGDVLEIEIKVNQEKTERREDDISNLMDDLFH